MPSLKWEVCTATVTLYSKFCATCGAKRDEETQAPKYYFNEGYEYEVILCFLLKYKPYYLATVTVNTAMDCKNRQVSIYHTHQYANSGLALD